MYLYKPNIFGIWSKFTIWCNTGLNSTIQYLYSIIFQELNIFNIWYLMHFQKPNIFGIRSKFIIRCNTDLHQSEKAVQQFFEVLFKRIPYMFK